MTREDEWNKWLRGEKSEYVVDSMGSHCQPTSPLPYRAPWSGTEWKHPESEEERRAQIEARLVKDFDLWREVPITCLRSASGSHNHCRVDLLAVPKICPDASIAIEIKKNNFDLQRSLKQTADYVNGRVDEVPNFGRRLTACFLYPAHSWYQSPRNGNSIQEGMYTLAAHWRVGRAFIEPYNHELVLALGHIVIWRSERGWTSRAQDMLLGRRQIGGSQKFDW